MLYLGIDLHAKQMTVCVRDESGEVICRRQVSTAGDAVPVFLAWVARTAGAKGYLAVIEVCGFHDWLVELLAHCGCREIVLVQPTTRERRKTDRIDAARLSELLWTNRERLLAGLPVRGLRRVVPPSAQDRDDRRLTQMRRQVGAQLTRVVNAQQQILRRRNIAQHCPTKGLRTRAARVWMRSLRLPGLDRLELTMLLDRQDFLERQRDVLDEQIAERAASREDVLILTTAPGVQAYSALALASVIAGVGRFKTPRSLPNYFGIVPSCNNSGESGQRLGSITKEGSSMARFILAQLVLHALRKDADLRAWYQRLKRRRGTGIARVAVMRRLAVIFWRMLSRRQGYAACRSPRPRPSPGRKRSRPAQKPLVR
jgi:transposase